MTVQISIIGLGQIGASVGLALAGQKDRIIRIGNDKDLSIVQKAHKIGAIDEAVTNLHKAVENSDLILLTLPVDQLQETITMIAQTLKQGAVVMETSPVKGIVAEWMAELLPESCHYVGLTPVLNPAYLHSFDTGIDGAHADLFRGGLMAIASPPTTNSAAIKLAADLTRLLGAETLFTDTAELDGLIASTHLLPQILAATLLNTTVDQPGWRDSRKIAGRAYAEATAPLSKTTSAEALKSAAILNRDNMLRAIDSAVASLMVIRNQISKEDHQALLASLHRASQGRENWWLSKQTGNMGGQEAAGMPELPKSKDIFANMFGIRRNPKSKP